MIDRGGFDRIDANLQKEVYLTGAFMSRIHPSISWVNLR
ncbi:hypothetical protein AZO1586R_822 [Bathymodiolus azoricus thioautotrophic gill symbiont]|uniref:Uncharacterized protein n=1 Tax=Bathymodiolus azoricus thioautotrophic gill symbiont TaxID=235205 RepID=A0ACA8ZP88_9GAMM|nr:hypothetical protein AZO1586R_822 [Bathymodiolus azoricus thioautotrophic gill symbiont]CAC9544988.1 hypothetical protein [uncultured Gammaproteobacteria bacterium]